MREVWILETNVEPDSYTEIMCIKCPEVVATHRHPVNGSSGGSNLQGWKNPCNNSETSLSQV